MDRLRSMEYFVRVTQAGSFAAAARELQVSPPAVTQTIAALEQRLGTTLLVRDSRGVRLTSDGEAYYHACARTLAELSALEANLRGSRGRLTGQLVVGMPTRIARNCILPELPAFLARHPGLTLDLRTVQTPFETAATFVDLMVVNTWQRYEDLIEREVARPRYLTCATPDFWRRHGMPEDPEALPKYPAIVFRTSQGAVLKEWKYQRGDVVRRVTIEPQVICDDRDSMMDLAVRGLGVVRANDLTMWPLLSQGLLVPAMLDWEGLEAPPIRLLYRRGGSKSMRVRVFAAFVEEVFARLGALRAGAGFSEPSTQPAPEWFLRLNRYPRDAASSRQ